MKLHYSSDNLTGDSVAPGSATGSPASMSSSPIQAPPPTKSSRLPGGSLFRMLPDFLIIGAQRAGTTSLFDALATHPEIRPGAHKEIHFFDLHFGRGIGWYRAHFPTLFQARWAALRGRKLVTGEATPYYLFHPLAAARAAGAVPRAKLIVILRNPIDRAWSQYCRVHGRGDDPLSFEDAIAVEEQRLAPETEKLLRNGDYYSPSHRRHSYLARGRYAEQIEAWFKSFDRSQFLFLESGRLAAEPAEVLSRVFGFLELASTPIREMPRRHRSENPPMAPATRRKLIEYFRPHNDRLRRLLGMDLDWDV